MVASDQDQQSVPSALNYLSEAESYPTNERRARDPNCYKDKRPGTHCLKLN